jgi:Fe2+ transport system protein FeoA
MSLKEAKKGQCVILENIEYGHKIKRKLQDMGLTPGVRFCVVSSAGFGPMIIDVRGSRVALGRGILEKITVRSAEA